ncbi:hypothetical protein [Agrobacterium vitis]|uniref:hypothetical protein n=1 Tax=Agrobacterium vitis TaxID=373 RepID=UPI0012EA04B6|nr:hypothetical protein [Agrobacterium vitis]MUO84809.1 hypothetical protein [Agrobacterium vitis]
MLGGRTFVLGMVIVGLAGCVTAPKGLFHRVSDGQRVDANPQLLAEFQQARVICDGEASKAALTSTERDRAIHSLNVNLVFDACLAQKGYVRR